MDNLNRVQYPALGFDDVMPFGKYQGKTIEWILDNDYSYLKWATSEANVTLTNDAWDDLQTEINENTK